MSRRPMTPSDPRHGTPAGYVAGCHADCCLIPRRRRDKGRELLRLRGVPSAYTADEVAAVIAPWLHQGQSRSSLMRAAGVRSERLLQGGSVLSSTYLALAALTEDDLLGSSWVYADLTRRRIFSLMAPGEGHPPVTRRRARSNGNRCRTCGHPIKLLGSPFTSSWRAFEPAPVNGRTHTGPVAFPSEAAKTYRLPVLVEDLMVRRGCSRGDAEDEAYDMPWYVLHTCPNDAATPHQEGPDQ